MEKLQPELRFPGFEGDWEVRKLENIFSTFKSGNGITSSKITEIGEYPVYGGNGLRGYTDTFTHDGFYFLIGRQGALCGNVNRSFGKSYISEHAIACSANETSDTEWLAQRLAYYNLNRLSESSAQPGLAVNKLLQLKLVVPTLPEQTKIAEFLTAIDKRIELLTAKKEKLTLYKKGVMQKIFNQEIRFKADDGGEFPDWEEKTLGDVVKIASGGSPTDLLDINGNIPFFKVDQLNNSSKYQFSTPYWISLNKSIVKKGSIIFPKRGAAILLNKVRIASVDFYMDTNLMSLTPNKEIFNEFLYYYILQSNLSRMADTTSIPQINNKHIEPYGIGIPTWDEQVKIATYLISVDELLGKVEQQITLNQKYKKGLLQKMFV